MDICIPTPCDDYNIDPYISVALMFRHTLKTLAMRDEIPWRHKDCELMDFEKYDILSGI